MDRPLKAEATTTRRSGSPLLNLQSLTSGSITNVHEQQQASVSSTDTRRNGRIKADSARKVNGDDTQEKRNNGLNSEEGEGESDTKKCVSFREEEVTATYFDSTTRQNGVDDDEHEQDESYDVEMVRKQKLHVIGERPLPHQKQSATDPRRRALRRHRSSRAAIGKANRRKRHLLNNLSAPVNAFFPSGDASDSNNQDHSFGLQVSNSASSEENRYPKQYNLRADKSPQSCLAKFFGRILGIRLEYDDINGMTRLRLCGLNFDQLVINYLHWCFRSSFLAVLASAFAAFLSLTMFFALILWIMGRSEPTCIGGVDFENDYFTDAFALSWTTFSTVGYGVIHSGTSSVEPNVSKCTGITIIVTLEAFVGVLFASFCLAIIFSKVGRAQSFAQVSFSDPILIRFGRGLLVDDAEELEDRDAEANFEEALDHAELHPCPVMELQLVNRLNDVPSGQIMDATIQMVASVNKDQAIRTSRQRTKSGRRKRAKGKKSGNKRSNDGLGPHDSYDSDDMDDFSEVFLERIQKHSASIRQSARDMEETGHTHESFEEDGTGHLVGHHVFSRLEVETRDHPLFQRTWIVRHEMNERSPLLTPPVRELIKTCGGLWPKDLANAEGIRAAVRFDQILTSFSGTSMADANTVYAQKIYEYDAINIGYRFVNMLYKGSSSGNLHVDHRLLNDVMEQHGGGAEQFDKKKLRNQGTISSMLAL